MARIRKGLLLAGFIAAVTLLARQHPQEANASIAGFRFGMGGSEARRLRGELDALRGELELARAQLDRANRVMGFSARFKVNAEIAGVVYDVALAEGIEPELAFRVVKVESQFNPRATSPVGAIGLAQVMPGTARYFDKTITRERLYEPRTNLRIGFRYLRHLIEEYDGDVELALLVYNRGPVAVESLRMLGLDPRNGYARKVMEGYGGPGVVH